MPRTAQFADKLQKVIQGIPDLIVDENMIYCTVCQKYFSIWHKAQCLKHIKCNVHRNNKLCGSPRPQFLFDLCLVLCVCSFSFHVVDNPHFRKFWKKYVPHLKMPGSRYLCQYFIPGMYSTVIDNIKSVVENKYIYVTVHETCDQQLNETVHVLVRCLELDRISPVYVICSKRVLKTTQSIVDVIESALNNVNIAADKVLLFVTDATTYMENAGAKLKEKYPYMIHVNCLAYGLHCVAEEVRKQYDKVDKFVFATENVFSEAPNLRRAFCNTVSNVPLPPNLVHTRWGTWLTCIMYYAKHFEEVKSFILTVNSRGSEAIATSKRYCQDPTIVTDIRNISQQFSILASAITKLETENLPLEDSLAVVNSVKETIDMYSDSHSVSVQQKLQSVLDNNPGYATLLQIRNELTSSADICDVKRFYSYGPLTSGDVERFCSIYKTAVRPPRMRLTEESVERILVITYYCNSLENPFSASAQQ